MPDKYTGSARFVKHQPCANASTYIPLPLPGMLFSQITIRLHPYIQGLAIIRSLPLPSLLTLPKPHSNHDWLTKPNKYARYPKEILQVTPAPFSPAHILSNAKELLCFQQFLLPRMFLPRHRHGSALSSLRSLLKQHLVPGFLERSTEKSNAPPQTGPPSLPHPYIIFPTVHHFPIDYTFTRTLIVSLSQQIRTQAPWGQGLCLFTAVPPRARDLPDI